MSEPKKRRSSWPVWVAVGIVALPVLYALSWGPVLYLVLSCDVSDQLCGAILAAYKPLRLARENCRPLEAFMGWYVQLWIALDPSDSP